MSDNTTEIVVFTALPEIKPGIKLPTEIPIPPPPQVNNTEE